MKNKIFGWIGMVWGAAIVISALLKDQVLSGENYAVGQIIAYTFGGILCLVGLYTVLKKKKVVDDA